MTDAPTPVVLDDQGSLRASPFVPTEGVTASGDGWPGPEYVDAAKAMGRILAEQGADRARYLNPTHAKPIENSPSPALGGTEAEGRSEHKDHPTPVGGLEPREWTPNCTLLLRTIAADANIADWASNPTMPDFLRAAADRIDTLQAEIERLKASLAAVYLLSGNGSQIQKIAFQAIGGKHD